MILLGTFQIEFPRPLKQINDLCIEGKIVEEIIVQNGHTNFESTYFKFMPFIPPDKLDELYDRATIIISHAGSGSILKGVKKGKKVIAIARLKKNAECVDDHQLEILDEFARMGYILPWNENDSLVEILEKAEHFVPQKYVSQKEVIISFLENYIDSL
ncbi:MAG: PssE/Cps14G family polysaccharide biosynthesis glycosyltransferase [Bacteroidota bacterium]